MKKVLRRKGTLREVYIYTEALANVECMEEVFEIERDGTVYFIKEAEIPSFLSSPPPSIETEEPNILVEVTEAFKPNIIRSRSRTRKARNSTADIDEWLSNTLSGKKMFRREVLALGEERGFSVSELKHSARRVGVDRVLSRGPGRQGTWELGNIQ
jgi:hypothetical protein